MDNNNSIKAESLQLLEPLDFAAFLSGDEKAQLGFAHSLIESFRTFGIVKLRSKDLPGCNIAGLFDMAERFFELDTKTKMVAAHPPQASPHRGYSFIGQEKISGITGFADGKPDKTALQDIKESFDMGSPEDRHFPNLWPKDEHIPHFRGLMESQYEALEHVQHHILRALAMGLGLPKEFFIPLHHKSHHEMRLLHYPSTTVGAFKNGKTRIADHTDFGSVTLLFQDATGGLEGRHPASGKYMGIESCQQECLVQLGDCFQRWTGGYLWALPHRVTMPIGTDAEDDEARIPERFSIAFFGKPNRDVDVGNLTYPHFQEVKYSSLTAGEYNNMKLLKTY